MSMNSFALFNCRQLKSHGTQGDPAPRRHRQPGRPGAWAPTPDQLEAPRRWPKNRNLSPTQQLAPIEHAPLPVQTIVSYVVSQWISVTYVRSGTSWQSSAKA